MSRVLGLVGIVLHMTAWSAFAQPIPVLSELVVKTDQKLSAPYAAKLRDAHAAGDIKALTEEAKMLLIELGQLKIADGCCNYETHYFEVAFIGRDEKGADALTRILIHDPDPERNILPGVKGTTEPYYAVFIDESPHIAFRGIVDVERVEDPLVKETADFVSAVVGKFALPVAVAQANFTKIQAAAATAPSIDYPATITLLKTVIPHARAKLTSKLFTHEPAMADSVVARATSLALREGDPVERGPAATNCDPFAKAMLKGVTTAVGASCGFGKADEDCVKAIKARIAADYAAGAMLGCSNALAIGRAFNGLAQSAPRFLSTSTALTNSPKRYVGFSLGTAVIGEVKNDQEEPRTKLSNGMIVVDTFPRLLLQGIVNVTPWGYSPDSFRPGLAESIRLQVGVAFAPYFGASLGGGVLLTRWLGLNVGRAWVWYDTPKGGAAAIGTQPTGNDASTPFKTAHTGVWFAGVTFSFTK